MKHPRCPLWLAASHGSEPFILLGQGDLYINLFQLSFRHQLALHTETTPHRGGNSPFRKIVGGLRRVEILTNFRDENSQMSGFFPAVGEFPEIWSSKIAQIL